MTEEYLVHHGILGMHWGIRRYQNKDGTLTPAGKKHYSLSNEADKSNDVKSMSDAELDRAINRLKKEAEYTKLVSKESNEKASKGESYVKKFLKEKGQKLASGYVDAAINSFIDRKFPNANNGKGNQNNNNKNKQDDDFDVSYYLKKKYLTYDSLADLTNSQREAIQKGGDQMDTFMNKGTWRNKVFATDKDAREARKADIRNESAERRKKLLRMAGVDI